MKRGHLSNFFDGVGVKILSVVDAEPKSSNQHEIGTTKKMRKEFLGEEHQKKFNVTYILFGKEGNLLTFHDWARHYDARINKPRAAEWRLYYPSNQVTESMKPGDILFLAKERSGSLLFIVTPMDSTIEKQLTWLFGLEPKGSAFLSKEISISERDLDISCRIILDEIGVEPDYSDDSELEAIIEKFGKKFPSTYELSSVVREKMSGIVNPIEDPDSALVSWINFEEMLFRLLEKNDVEDRLKMGFYSNNEVDIDGFIKFSLSVHNRRKSRMGHSLEHHLKAIFDKNKLVYERGVITENNKKPDFLFPSKKAYDELPQNHPSLMILGAKSSCKDRWRQVLDEADKISLKHLLTLQPSVSVSQTNQMKQSGIQLVLPKEIHKTYTDKQQTWICSVKEFIEMVAKKQSSR
ncbi:MAG: type II restriction endonuclease [Paracoccaceae bacterium]|nr:type II restriction endonuclease [Paracoccaceae bacterium]MDE2674858.1 type II restriction endonuclease [Paracoccaceae bacterium]